MLQNIFLSLEFPKVLSFFSSIYDIFPSILLKYMMLPFSIIVIWALIRLIREIR